MKAPWSFRNLIAGAVAVVVLTGCLTGERPVLSAAPEATGDAAADAVLSRLALAPTATFTASYTIATTQQPPVTADAAVVQDGRSRRSVTIGGVRYVVSESGSATCDTDAGGCDLVIDESRVSDLLVSSNFYGAGQANRLRNDARLRTGATVASTEPIAGQTATCVTIPVATTTSTYCALDNGVLARLEAADLTIEMTGFVETVDVDEFEIPAT